MLPQSFRTIPPALLWRQSPKKLVIGRRSSVQSGILSLWITWSCSPFYTLLIFITLQPLELPFLPFLCLMFCLSIFVSFSFSQSSCVAPMLQCFNLYFYPLFTPPSLTFFSHHLRWESIFCHVVGGRSRWLDPPYFWLPETPEDGECVAAEWVGGGSHAETIKV